MEIEKTKDYAKFKILDANREVKQNHVNNLVNSIRANNLLSTNPIIVNKNFEVLDGQHRLKACEILNTEVYYVMCKQPQVYEDIIRLNTVNEKWKGEDFLNLYLRLDVFEYRVLELALKRYDGLGLSLLIKVMGRGNSPSKDFRHSKIKFKDNLKEVYINLDRLMDLRNHIPFYKRYAFASAFLKVCQSEDYDHDRMLEKIEKHKDKLEFYAKYQDNLRSIETVYNFGSSKKVRLF